MDFIGFVSGNIWTWLLIAIVSYGINLILTGTTLFRIVRGIFGDNFDRIDSEFSRMTGKIPILMVCGVIGLIAAMLFVLAAIIEIIKYIATLA